MFEVVLFEPEIPPNTGNIIRLCVNVGARLHLVEPLGFDVSDRYLRRAGLDYAERASLHVHPNLPSLWTVLPERRVWAFTTRGSRLLQDVDLAAGDVLLFGPESRGLPSEVLASLPPDQRVRIPMRPDSRSLNLSNSVAVALFEGYRQLGYPGLS